MEDEDEPIMPQMPPVMRVAAMNMTADLILAFGIIFMLLGAASFVTDLLKIKGSGEILVGLALCAIAIAILRFSKKQMARMPPPAPPPPPPVQGLDKKDESASYRGVLRLRPLACRLRG